LLELDKDWIAIKEAGIPALFAISAPCCSPGLSSSARFLIMDSPKNSSSTTQKPRTQPSSKIWDV